MDVPDLLNRLDRQGSDYASVEKFIGLLSEADEVPERLRRAIAAVSGNKFEPNYRRLLPERPPLHSTDDLPLLISRRYAILAHTPAPRNEEEWKARRAPPLGRLAERIAALFLSGYWDKLHLCQVCRKWFLGRKDARTCKAACRERKSERREGFRSQRRAWLLENQIIPRIEARVKKLLGPANRLRREKWERRLADYQKELGRSRIG